MIKTTAGQAIINSYIPEEFRDYNRELNKKNLTSLLGDVARKYPGKYKNVVSNLKAVGQKVAYLDGSSFSLDDFAPTADRTPLLNANRDFINGKIDKDKVHKIFAGLQDSLTNEAVKEGIKKGNKLAQMVVSGSRGKPSQLTSTIISPIMFSDVSGKPVPVPILNSLAEGLEPAEYWAMSPGTRKGVVSTKFSTPISGYFNKQLGYVTSEIIVSEQDCGTTNGVKTPVDDAENLGRSLAMSVAGYPAGTVLTTRILSDIKKRKKKFIIIRSPSTCEADKGVCQKCYGCNETGRLPEIGHNVGLNNSASMSEPFTQGALDVKHGGGLLTNRKSGIELVQQILKIPKTFAGGATVSELDGKIESIKDAPQGGKYIKINDKDHYVSPGLDIKVKQGQSVEPGEILSDGVVNPADVTRLRGIGEGRKFLADTLKQAYIDDGKGNVNKIHMESLASKMVDHVKITDHTHYDNFVNGDIVSFSRAQKDYRPKNVQVLNPKSTIGKYLAKPAQHYTIGTKLTPKMIKDIEETGIKQLEVTDHEPPFTPVMVRLDDIPAYKENWVERLYSIHLKDKLTNSAHRGEKANIRDIYYSPAALYGKDFGRSKIGY